MNISKQYFVNREINWLAFNHRVLQEAADARNPLIERVKFLGIFSNNMDEFFRVRYASIRRMVEYGASSKGIFGGTPQKLLKNIQFVVQEMRSEFDSIYQQLLRELNREGIFLLDETRLNEEQQLFVRKYFHEQVRPQLTPLMVDRIVKFPVLADKRIYLAVEMIADGDPPVSNIALIEVPSNILPRFLVLPSDPGTHSLILLDDIIRFNLKEIFYQFDYQRYEAYTIKITRDAELDIDHDISVHILDQITDGLKRRKQANTVRFIYDRQMKPHLLQFFIDRLQLSEHDNISAGGRYHNFKDFMKFPGLGMTHLLYPSMPPLSHKHVKPYTAIFETISRQDALLHFPYQSFHHIIDFLRESAIDPQVSSIYITLYRVANPSAIGNALINAIRNGKKVTVVIELAARFDEESNIYWAERLKEEGAEVIYGVPGLKVHCKLCLVVREENKQEKLYANIATGNFNEQTARIYTDKSLLTSHPQITAEVRKVFEFFQNNLKIPVLKHLVMAPFSLRKKLLSLIQYEIQMAKAGKPAYMIIKINSLIDAQMIRKLYEASQAGVKIQLIVRGVCSLVPGVPGISDHIEVISIVDRYLEHSRVYIFGHGGDEKYYISSADWMTRNLDHRVEIACPIYDPEIQKELKDILLNQFLDNMKARIIHPNSNNAYRVTDSKTDHRAQEDIYRYLKWKHATSP